jgi:hypothetical protein
LKGQDGGTEMSEQGIWSLLRRPAGTIHSIRRDDMHLFHITVSAELAYMIGINPDDGQVV